MNQHQLNGLTLYISKRLEAVPYPPSIAVELTTRKDKA